MKISFFETDNFRRMSQSIDALQNRDEEVPGLALVHGFAGLGKTKAVARYAVHRDCIYVRANAAWTTLWMLQDICSKLGVYPFSRTQRVFVQCIDEMQRQNRTIFIDEADYLIHDNKMLETIRDLHDWTGIPVVLVGMQEIVQKMGRHKQFYSRVSQIVEFKTLNANEIRQIAQQWAVLNLSDGAAEGFQKITGGDFRLVTVGLGHLERMAKANNSAIISAKMVEMAGKMVARRAA